VYRATVVVLVLLVMLTYSRTTVTVSLPAEAVESRPSIDTANSNFNDDTSDTGPVNMIPLMRQTLQRTPTNTIPNKSDTTATKTYKNLTLVANSSKMFSGDHQIPQGNQTTLSITEYIKLLFNLSHIEPDEEFDSVQVMQKQLNLTHCLYYQIENEKMVYALFDLWKVYLALHNIWFPTAFEKYLTRAIEGVTHWSYQNLTLHNHIKDDLVKATTDLITMKIVLGVTNVTLMNMIQKILRVTEKVLLEQLMAGAKVKDLVVGVQKTIHSQIPAYHKSGGFHARYIYYPSLERYLSSVTITMNARDVCYKVFASL